jgi:membrane peptidoglycan carboxypeptidase
VSNPDFPGPYWQEKPEPYDRRTGYGDDRDGADGYGRSRANYDRSGDGWPGEWTREAAAGSGGGSRGRGRHGGRPAADNGSSYDVNGGSVPADGASADSTGRRGWRGQPGRSRGGVTRRVSRAGYVSSDHGSTRANGGNGNGRYAGSYGTSGDAGYGDGYANGASGYGNGTSAYGNGTSAYGNGTSAYGNGAPAYGTGYRDADGSYRPGDASRTAYGSGPGGYDDGFVDARTGYYGDTQLADDGFVPMPGDDGWGPGDPDDPYGPGGPGRRRLRMPGGPRRRGSWWRHWTPRKAAALIGCLALGMVLVMIAGFFYIYNRVQLPLSALSKPFVQSTQVYFADGKTPVGCFCSTNRTVLSASELAKDPYLEQAFFAAEDRHFLTEGGISLTGTLRALIVDLTGSGHQGGSTITEQYVKTYFDQTGGSLTWKEKIKEIIDAIKLAKAKPKQWILSHYLNAIYLGNHSNGVEAAAQSYFGKHAWQLDAAHSAMLAAMVQEPSGFDPHKPTADAPGLNYSLLDRWVYVLGNMARDTLPDGKPVLTQQQYQKLIPDPSNPQADLKNFPKVLKASSAAVNWSGFRGYIMNAVARELMQRYGFKYDNIFTAGLHITTTFSLTKMHALYAAVAEAKKMMRLGGQALPGYAHIGAILENPRTGAIEASYAGPDYTANHCKRIDCKWDMAMQSRNQVGSSFKPYVLAAAVKEHMNVQTSVLNGYSPLCVPPETQPLTRSKRGPASSCPKDGVGWLPVSYDPVVEGPTSVAKAAALSSNAAFEDLAHRVGTKPIIKLAGQFGVDISHAYSSAHPHSTGSGLVDDVGKVGIALGIAPLTVEEQATTFATLANGGMYHTPHVIAKMTRNGNNVPLNVSKHRVLTLAEAADVDWALSFDTVYGTGVPNAVLSPPRPTIGKTGTTDVAQSAFFIGALPGQYSMAVGMFTNSQNNVKGGQTLDVLPYRGTGGGFGGAWPATIWQLAMTRLLAAGHKPIAQLAPLNLNGFKKWVQVTKPKPKCGKHGPPGGGNGGPGNGNGHGHHHGILATPFGKVKCPTVSPSPGPTTSPSPGPTTTVSPPPSPPTSTSPSPSPSNSFPALPAKAPSRKSPASTPSLTIAATLPQPAFTRPIWIPATTGLA